MSIISEVRELDKEATDGPWHTMDDGFARSGLWSAPTVYATDDELRYIAVCACASVKMTLSLEVLAGNWLRHFLNNLLGA